jgi:polyhydroxyalkanoate synthesis regulator phasin
VQKPKNVPLSQATTTVAPTYSTITNSGTNISSNESEFVSRADYNALLQKVDRLEKVVEDLQKKLLK